MHMFIMPSSWSELWLSGGWMRAWVYVCVRAGVKTGFMFIYYDSLHAYSYFNKVYFANYRLILQIISLLLKTNLELSLLA